MNNRELLANISEYVKDEAQDSRYYAALAEKAPTERAKNLILDMSKDEQRHAQSLAMVYFDITHKKLPTPVTTTPVIGDFNDAVKERIIAETKDYKKYGMKYLAVPDEALKELFFMIRTDEAIHAMRMPILLNGG